MKSIGNMTPVTKGLITLVVLGALFFGAKQFVGNKSNVTTPSDSTVVATTADTLQKAQLPADGTVTIQTETIAPSTHINVTPTTTTTPTVVKPKTVKTVKTTKPVVKEKKKSTDRENLELGNF